MKIVVEYATCSGIGICESIAPAYYEVNDDGELVLLEENVSEADLEIVQRTVTECPTGALTLHPS